MSGPWCRLAIIGGGGWRITCGSFKARAPHCAGTSRFAREEILWALRNGKHDLLDMVTGALEGYDADMRDVDLDQYFKVIGDRMNARHQRLVTNDMDIVDNANITMDQVYSLHRSELESLVFELSAELKKKG